MTDNAVTVTTGSRSVVGLFLAQNAALSAVVLVPKPMPLLTALRQGLLMYGCPHERRFQSGDRADCTSELRDELVCVISASHTARSLNFSIVITIGRQCLHR